MIKLETINITLNSNVVKPNIIVDDNIDILQYKNQYNIYKCNLKIFDNAKSFVNNTGTINSVEINDYKWGKKKYNPEIITYNNGYTLSNNDIFIYYYNDELSNFYYQIINNHEIELCESNQLESNITQLIAKFDIKDFKGYYYNNSNFLYYKIIPIIDNLPIYCQDYGDIENGTNIVSSPLEIIAKDNDISFYLNGYYNITNVLSNNNILDINDALLIFKNYINQMVFIYDTNIEVKKIYLNYIPIIINKNRIYYNLVPGWIIEYKYSYNINNQTYVTNINLLINAVNGKIISNEIMVEK